MKLALVVLVLAVVLFLGGYCFFCVFMMVRNVSPGRWRIAALLPLALFDNSLFNETGNFYRKQALTINVVLMVLLVILVVVLRSD